MQTMIPKRHTYFHSSQTEQTAAFTLAEVLITIVIIGIIAAITVPSVMNTTQKQEFVSKLKKAHSVLCQSTYRIAMKSGYPVGDFSFMQNNDFFDMFIQEVNVAKSCKDEANNCFSDNVKYLNGSYGGNYNTNNSVVTTDGIAYQWLSDSNRCNYKGLSQEDLTNCIGGFIVDLNGQKKPNMFGRDIFFFTVVNEKGIVAAGSGNNSATCTNGGGDGVQCAAKVLREGKISY